MQTSSIDTANRFQADASALRGRVQQPILLLTGEEDAPDNYVVRYGQDESQEGEPNRMGPRHRHNFDQIRYPLDGEIQICDERVIPAGWVGYFPESVFYGPNGLTPNVNLLVLQFGGATGFGINSISQNRKGREGLKAKGRRFEEGLVVWEDENGKTHKQDGFEALMEETLGHKVEYAPPRYDDILLINPEGFPWQPLEDHPGVWHKVLGTFTARDLRIGFFRIEPGATLPFGTHPSTEIGFLQKGLLEHNGETHAYGTAFSTTPNDPAESLTGIETADLFYVKLPTF
jgi:quercetin dioxygenase-like cupin family protein